MSRILPVLCRQFYLTTKAAFMSLRRLAQENYATTAFSSPKSPESVNVSSQSPLSPALPSTPRNKQSYSLYRSPASTPSISSSVPFDWDAARSRKPPPYSSPLQNKGRKSMGVGTPNKPARRGIVRKLGFWEKISSFPSSVAFYIALFPQNVPVPEPITSARLIGGSMHFLHLCIRVSQMRKISESELGWEDMYQEGSDDSWFDWTTPISFLLVAFSVLNTIYLFSRIKSYHFHHRTDPIASPHATYVSTKVDRHQENPPSLTSRILANAWFSFSYFWRFLFGLSPPTPSTSLTSKTIPIQQLNVWTPGNLETELFCVYSPAHAFLWIATASINWALAFLIMGLVGGQLHFLTHAYKALMKDKEIIAAEVMHEYNKGFVYPRVNPVRKDVAVMTHESEIVNIWDE